MDVAKDFAYYIPFVMVNGELAQMTEENGGGFAIGSRMVVEEGSLVLLNEKMYQVKKVFLEAYTGKIGLLLEETSIS
jgi:hypothetical protein